MIEVAAVHMEYPTPTGPLVILREVTLRCAAGESASISGPSGSGKSTLLNIVGSLEPPTAGRVTINGCDLYALQPRELARFRNQQIGLVFQDHHLLPQCTVLENVLLPALAGANPNGDCVQRARRLLDRVGLAHRADHRPAQLSGGERQRVALARALVNEPAVVLADEPTGSLDQATAEEVATLLWELHDREARVLIVVTHNPHLAERAGRRFDLQDGLLVERSIGRSE